LNHNISQIILSRSLSDLRLVLKFPATCKTSKLSSWRYKLNTMKSGYFIKHLTGTLFFIFILFVSAGRINYWQGLVYLGIGLVMFTLN